jgi:hypothetical protein
MKTGLLVKCGGLPRKFLQHDKRWILRLIKNNPKLHSTKLAAETEKHLHSKVNHDRSQKEY